MNILGITLEIGGHLAMMFETFESDRIPLGSQLATGGAHTWAQVRMGDFSPQFMVVVGPTSEFLPETWLIARPSDLITALAAIKHEFPMRPVLTYLLSPSHMNKTLQWQIEPLAEIWENYNIAYCEQALRYVLKDGRVYFQGITELEGSITRPDPNWKRIY